MQRRECCFSRDVSARPDQCCAACGLAALVRMWSVVDSGIARGFVQPGLLLGAGLLFHPFAITYCLVAGVWTLIGRATGSLPIGAPLF